MNVRQSNFCRPFTINKNCVVKFVKRMRYNLTFRNARPLQEIRSTTAHCLNYSQ